MNYEKDPRIMRYIPTKKQAAILTAYHDEDGYWIGLKPGWHASRTDEGIRTIHEDTITELRYQVAGIEPYEE